MPHVPQTTDACITIYVDPLTMTRPEGLAQPLRCVDDDVATYDGYTQQRWQVRFQGERRVVERFVLIDPAPDGTPWVLQRTTWPCGHTGMLRLALIGQRILAGADADHCPQCDAPEGDDDAPRIDTPAQGVL